MPGRFENQEINYLSFAFAGVILAPLFETLFLQWAPIELTRRLRLEKFWQFSVSTLVFAAAHYSAGIVTFIGVGFVSGAYLAFAYLAKRDISPKAAFLQAWTMHFLINIISIGIGGIGLLSN
ncbi:MAG: CPBP family glutamic-type intramembrane protease [Pseudobdellovibrionaceae bacterium]|nr:CPBP family glutamic-type intramembrane protease [Pseudobdellovibrionaceae bacterium]